MKTIIRLSFIELQKKKIIYVVLLLTLAFFVFYGLILHFTYREIGKFATEGIEYILVSSQLLSLGIYGIGFITAFFSIFASVGAVSSEIEDNGYDAIVSKPIGRWEIILGKYIGILSVLLIYVTLLFTGVLGLNQFFGSEFLMEFSFVALVKSLFFFYLLPMVLVALGITFSVRMSTIASGTVVVILYFCGMVGGLVEQISNIMMANTSAGMTLKNIGIITSLIIPTDIIYRKASNLLYTTKSGMNFNIQAAIGGDVASQPSKLMIVYTLVYVIVLLVAALRNFEKRDL